MNQDRESQPTAEVIAGVDATWASDNGFGAPTAPRESPNPALMVGAALVGGFLLARLVRRLRG
jgi:hypothetical protein